MRFRNSTLILPGLLLALCLALLAVFLYGELGTSLKADQPRTVTVRRGESVTALAERLHQEGALDHPGFFRFLTWLRGESTRVRAGEFVLQGRVSPGALIQNLVHGESRLWRFTVPEGYSIRDIAAKLEREGKGRAAEFSRLAADAAFIASLNLPVTPAPASLEGFLFPETYYFSAGTSEQELLRSMTREFVRRVSPLLRERSLGLEPYQVLTLASIIEKETGVPEERGLISAVFHNRLKAGMRLYSDPTVIYGIDGFDGNLTRRQLETDSPYNTYRVEGLPPTPIANPGIESIQSALEPARVDYLYFVAKGDGTHHFTRTYKAHSQAVWFYQKQPNRKRNS
jgi:UPF0755 protein